MPSIPGYCDNCGLIFDGEGGIHFEGNTSFNTVIGARMTCPRCGQMARLVDGTFSTDGKKLRLDSGPPRTIAILERLRQAEEKLKSGEITPEQALREVEKAEPWLGQHLRHFSLANVLSLLAFIIALYSTYADRQDAWSNDAFQREILSEIRRLSEGHGDASDVTGLSYRSAGRNSEADMDDARAGKPKHEHAERLPSKRRAQVNADRRQSLKEHRLSFPRHPRGRPLG